MWIFLLISLFEIAKGNIKVGSGLSLFERYGYLSYTMRVLPLKPEEKWIFREPIVDILQNASSTEGLLEVDNYNGGFNMEFCQNVPQLLQAYFRDFQIDRVENPWKAFTGGLRASMAGFLGLNMSHVNDNNCYILLRFSRFRVSRKLIDNFNPSLPILRESVANSMKNVKIGNVTSVMNFIKNHGSHYVSSYSTGNALYQVIVYSSDKCGYLTALLQNRSISSFVKTELTSLMSPSYAKHLGIIKSASGNASLSFHLNSLLLHSQSLLVLQDDRKLWKELDEMMKNEAILHLNLKTLAPYFYDKGKREWFLEVVDNNLRLWEENL